MHNFYMENEKQNNGHTNTVHRVLTRKCYMKFISTPFLTAILIMMIVTKNRFRNSGIQEILRFVYNILQRTSPHDFEKSTNGHKNKNWFTELTTHLENELNPNRNPFENQNSNYHKFTTSSACNQLELYLLSGLSLSIVCILLRIIMMAVEIQLIFICKHGLENVNCKHAKAGEFLCRWEIVLDSYYVVLIVFGVVGAVMRTWYYSEFDWIVRILLMFSFYLVSLCLCFIVENLFLIGKLRNYQKNCAVSDCVFDENEKPYENEGYIDGRTEILNSPFGSKVLNHNSPNYNAPINQLAKYRL